MKITKRYHSATFKLKVATEALLQHSTIAEIASKYKVHPTQINNWKRTLQNQADTIFDGPKTPQEIKQKQTLIDELYKQIGQQKVECDWLKKKCDQLPP